MRKEVRMLIAMLLSLLTLAGCAASGAPTTDTEPAVRETTIPESVPVQEDDGYAEQFRLSNPNANVTTQKVYDYLCSLSGVNCLSAQMESTQTLRISDAGAIFSRAGL